MAAVRELSLGIPSGVFAALKGRSGSGKTTLLNMLGGLDRPSTGEIYLFGKPIAKMSADELTDLRRHKIGFVFQSFAIMRDRAMRCLEIVGLHAWAHHRPWELSGGQQQRVAIARALATHPSLILADEPTGELDSATGRQILALFRYIVEREGITIIMATHDPVIEEYAHIVYELGDGQVRNIHRPTKFGTKA